MLNVYAMKAIRKPQQCIRSAAGMLNFASKLTFVCLLLFYVLRPQKGEGKVWQALRLFRQILWGMGWVVAHSEVPTVFLLTHEKRIFIDRMTNESKHDGYDNLRSFQSSVLWFSLNWKLRFESLFFGLSLNVKQEVFVDKIFSEIDKRKKTGNSSAHDLVFWFEMLIKHSAAGIFMTTNMATAK